MAQNKTTENENSVADFLATIADGKKSKDCAAIINIIEQYTGMPAKMWGNAIIGFGSYHYKYDSGREGDAPLAALSPRASSITLYLADVVKDGKLLQNFGKHKVSGGIHIKKLEDIDTDVLKQMTSHSINYLQHIYPD